MNNQKHKEIETVENELIRIVLAMPPLEQAELLVELDKRINQAA